MATTDTKMLKRKGADDVLADVDESKKSKSDPPTEESTGDKSTDPTIAQDPSNEESTENKPTSVVETSTVETKPTNPTNGTNPPNEESMESEPSMPTVEALKAKSTNLANGSDPSVDESTEINSTNPAVELIEDVTLDPEDDSQYMQVIITGPPKCGKSCLVCSYMEQMFPPKQGEFLSKQYLHILPETKRAVMIWDLDSRKALAEYRYQSYKEADIALLCFNVKMPKDLQERSLENLLLPWMNELDSHCGKIPIILVGLKGDLRRKCNSNCFGEDEIKKVLKRYQRIVLYKEVSAFVDKNSVKELFATSIACIDEPKPKVMFITPDSEMGLGDR